MFRYLLLLVFLTSLGLGCSSSRGAKEAPGLAAEIAQLRNDYQRLRSELVEIRAARQSIKHVSDAIVELAASVSPSVVRISSDLRYLKKNGGGFIYNRDGIILTHDHLLWIDLPNTEGVVKRHYARLIKVWLHDGRRAEARIVGIDPDTDLAALKIDLEDLPEPLQLSERRLQQGEMAFSIGHPLQLPFSLEWRPISATYRSGRLPGTDVHQVDRGFFDGNSGGPLFDLDGKVVGLIYSTFNYKDRAYRDPTDPTRERKVVYSTIGWAVPSETMTRIAPELIDGAFIFDPQ